MSQALENLDHADSDPRRKQIDETRNEECYGHQVRINIGPENAKWFKRERFWSVWERKRARANDATSATKIVLCLQSKSSKGASAIQSSVPAARRCPGCSRRGC